MFKRTIGLISYCIMYLFQLDVVRFSLVLLLLLLAELLRSPSFERVVLLVSYVLFIIITLFFSWNA